MFQATETITGVDKLVPWEFNAAYEYTGFRFLALFSFHWKTNADWPRVYLAWFNTHASYLQPRFHFQPLPHATKPVTKISNGNLQRFSNAYFHHSDMKKREWGKNVFP